MTRWEALKKILQIIIVVILVTVGAKTWAERIGGWRGWLGRLE